MSSASIEQHKAKASAWFESLRDRICEACETIEREFTGPPRELSVARFEQQSWTRAGDATDGGGGVTSIMRGRVFEKIGVNV